MGETHIDMRQGAGHYDRPTDERHRFVVERRHGLRIEMEDLHFHLDSAVTMPDPHLWDPFREPVREEGITGLSVLDACIRHAVDYSDHKLLIAGHTDSSGPREYNAELSLKRADNALHLLLGDKDAWVEICLAQHKIADYKQILHWLSFGELWGLSCDPGPVNNVWNRRTRAAVKRFQRQYNDLFDQSIDDDGIVGRQTWGAFFDVYEVTLAHLLEVEREELASKRAALRFLDDGARTVGCGELYPIPSAEREDYRSPNNRRVELLFFEPGEEPVIRRPAPRGGRSADISMVYDRRVYAIRPLPVEPEEREYWLDVQTVDEFGVGVGDVDLELRPHYAEPVRIATDANGYWSGHVRSGGFVDVYQADGSPVEFTFSAQQGAWSEAPHGGVPTARLDPRIGRSSVADLLIPRLDPAPLQKRNVLVDHYGSPLLRSRRTGGAPLGTVSLGEPLIETSGRGDAEERHTRRAWSDRLTDNLTLVAGWQDGRIDEGALRGALHAWLQDRHPSLVRQGYILYLVRGRKLLVFGEHESTSQEALGRFDLHPRVVVGARIGAYATLEFHGASGNLLFRDLGTLAAPFTAGPRDADDGAAGDLEEPDWHDGTSIGALIHPSQQGDFERLVLEQSSDGRKRELVYRVPSPGLFHRLARNGGTGLLENYSAAAGNETNRRFHDRNLAVVENSAAAYRGYLQDYIRRVEATRTELELWNLGPPESPYRFPRPIGATQAQRDALLRTAGGASSYAAWLKIGEHLDHLFHRRSAGDIWLKLEFGVDSGWAFGPYDKFQAKWNFTVDDDGNITPLARERTETITIGLADSVTGPITDGAAGPVGRFVNRNQLGGGVTVEINHDTNERKTGAFLQVRGYKFETSDDGTMKLSARGIEVQANQRQWNFGGGFSFGIKDLVKKYTSDASGNSPPWVDALPDANLGVGLYFQSVRSGQVLAMVSSAPGFFERRPLTQLMQVSWATLDGDEQRHLRTLGWNRGLWDVKDYQLATHPESAAKPYEFLSAEEKVAVVHLGLPAFEPDWVKWWRSARVRPGAPPELPETLGPDSDEGEGEPDGEAVPPPE